jgi:uncharacterized delta-60 repeat protein
VDDTQTVVIVVRANPTPTITESACDVPTPGNVTLDAGGGYSSYLWSTTETSQAIVVAGDGLSYDVTVTDANGCQGSASHTTMACVGALTWARTYGGVSIDEAWSIQQTTDGGYVVAGVTQSFGAGGEDFWVLKLDASGYIQWQKTFGGASVDEARSIQQTTDGSYVVAGQTLSFGEGSFDYWVLKLYPDGTIDWKNTYGGASWDEARSIQQTTDDGFIVAGRTQSFGAGGWDAWVLKLLANGNVDWQKTYGGSNGDKANSIQQTFAADGTLDGYIVAGETYSFGVCDEFDCTDGLDNDGDFLVDESNGDFWVLKLDAWGNVLWQKTFGGASYDEAWSIQQTTDGGYVVAGWTKSFGMGDYDFWILKLDADGNVDPPLGWQKTYGGNNTDVVFSIQQTTDEGFVVAGYTESFGAGGWDAWVLKLLANGNVDWQKIYGGSNGDKAYSIQQTFLSDGTPDGYVVAGETDSFGAGNTDFWGLKLDADGNIDPSCAFITGTAVTGEPSGASVTLTGVSGEPSSADVNAPPVTSEDSTAAVDEQCGLAPSLLYSSHTFTDCGNDDGVVNPGETIDLDVTVLNTSGVTFFYISGVLSTITPGITITDNTAAFPDIQAGLTGESLPLPFRFFVDVGVPCGTLIDFTLDLTYEDSWGNPFFDAASFQVPVSAGGPVTFLSEDFNLGLPGTWTVMDGGNGPDTWADADPCARGLFPDTYMIMDGDCALLGARVPRAP